MKKIFGTILLVVGITTLMASCQCKTCKKAGEPSIQVCRGDGTEEEYNQQVDGLVAGDWDCK